MRRTFSWSFLATAPILALLGFELVGLLNGYDGNCGLLDAGWKCSRAEYVFSAFFSPFILPVLLIYSVGWLLLVFIAFIVTRKISTRNHIAK